MSLLWEGSAKKTVKIPDGTSKKAPKEKSTLVIRRKGKNSKAIRTQSGVVPLPESTWARPKGIPRMDSGDLVIDIETHDPMLKTHGPGWAFDVGYIVGIALAWENGHAYYPLRHPDTENFNEAGIYAYLAKVCANPKVRVICHNAGYDFGWLWHNGVVPPDGRIVDTMLCEALLDEHANGYNLDAVAKRRLGTGKDETLLRAAADHYNLDPKAGIAQLPARYVADYAAGGDAVQTWRLAQKLQPLMEFEDLGRISKLEHGLTVPLLEMRASGVAVDLEQVEKVRKEFQQEEDRLQREINRAAGFKVDVYDVNSLARLAEKRGIQYPRTAKKQQPSFTADWLEACPDPALQMVSSCRVFHKARGTYLDGYILGKQVNGRIHGNFHQLMSDEGGTVSGRFSSSLPNLQNIPSRDPIIGPAVRKCFVPEPGEYWGAVDYSQQEPRLTVHYASIVGARGSRIAVEAYTNDPTTNYHKWVAALTGLPDKDAKIINLGITYGMGGASLCRDLGLPTVMKTKNGRTYPVAGPEGQKILDLYHAKLPFVRVLQDKCKQAVEERGFLTTLGGRRCRFRPEDSTHKALNRLIQASAADMLKMAMRKVWEAGYGPYMRVTVHDELGFSYREDEVIQGCGKVMVDAVKLRVPVLVDIERGPSWGEAA